MSGISWRRGSVPGGPTGEMKPGLLIESRGIDSLETAEAIDGDWQRVPLLSLQQPTDAIPKGFFRPPTMEGVLAGPQDNREVAYVQVGLLKAYDNPGLNLSRGVPDNNNNFTTELFNGLAGGSGENRWSGSMNLPFTFRFFGRPYKQFRVSKNGLLTFSTNVVTARDGLDYFDFPDPANNGGATRLTNALPLWSNGFPIDETVFCMVGRHVTQTASDTVVARVHGSAPKRQVWIIFRHVKDTHGRTTTAIVLEETSNRIFLMDMQADTAGGGTTTLLAGIQGSQNSTREVRQVPATPNVRLASSNNSLADNGCYLFRPYVVGAQVTGQATTSITTVTNLDQMILERMRRDNMPGLNVAITRNGRLIFNKGYGFANVEKSELMQPYHRACIGSVSKVIAAIGVEKLIQDEKINSLNSLAFGASLLGQPWFGEAFQEGVAAGIHGGMGIDAVLGVITNVTVRHLLSHTAAFGNNNDDIGAANAYADGDYTQLLPRHHVQRFIATRPLITNAVGVFQQYSNPSYKMVGVLIEQAAGQLFEPWMMQNVLVPGGAPFARLMRTYQEEETWRDARRYHFYASGAPWAASRIDGVLGPRTYGDAIYANAADGAAGSWTMSAMDLARLLAALDKLPNKKEILDPERIDELEERAFPATLTNNQNQGIGWDTSSPSGWVSKNGNIGWGSAQVRRSTAPDRLTVAVVVNSGIGNVSGLTTDLYNIVRPIPAPAPLYDLFPGEKKAN